MRLPVALVLLAIGAWLLVPDLLPPAARPSALPLPQVIAGNVRGIGLGAAGLGALLILVPGAAHLLRGRGRDLDDGPIRRELARRGFDHEELMRGWIARGTWDGTSLVVRRLEGGEASRFARPWMIDVAVPGKPSEPWPLMPTQAKIVEVRPGGFTVVMPEVTYAPTMSRFPVLVAAVLRSRG